MKIMQVIFTDNQRYPIATKRKINTDYLCVKYSYPSVPVRAVAPTFSWYAGCGRIGFDSQLWGMMNGLSLSISALITKLINSTW